MNKVGKYTSKGNRVLFFVLLLFALFGSVSAQTIDNAAGEKDSIAEIAKTKNVTVTETKQSINSNDSDKTNRDLNFESLKSEISFAPRGTSQKSADLEPPAANKRNPFAELKDLEKNAVRGENGDDAKTDVKPEKTGFDWKSAFKQSLLFLGVQHGYAFTQSKTRRELKGNFFKDYFKSVKSLRGWEDGGRFFTNYIAHPMQGSMTGFIQIQNDSKGKKLDFGTSGDYWRSRLKAMAWSAAWSTQFEIGPLSQASIGNVGLKGKQTWVDIVITPTVGTAMLIAEDAADKYLIRRFETKGFYAKIFSRMLLNPTRTLANTIRFKAPWHRDNR